MQGHYTKGNKTYPCTVTKKDNVVYNVNKGKVRDAYDNKMSTRKTTRQPSEIQENVSGKVMIGLVLLWLAERVL